MYRAIRTSAALAVTWLAVSPAFADDCGEKVVIDSVSFPVTDYWCGRKFDSVLVAKPEGLVQIPQDFTFEDYRIYVLPQVRDAFVRMAGAARKDSVELIADSGFRSVSYQRKIIKNRMAAGETMEHLLKSVAPPGYSQHHTGRSLDLCPSEARFARTKAYRWLKEHAAAFGFQETIPNDPAYPGTWESWHWTYLGDLDPAAVKKFLR